MIIEITSLHLNVIETDLQRLFTPFGEISSIEILRDRLNNRSRGKAIIKMPVEKEANQAATSLNGTMVSGKSIVVTLVPLSDEGDQKKGLLQ
jgi:RNA recognition motif-containing protein